MPASHRDALLLNGRVQNIVYGSYAPGAPALSVVRESGGKVVLTNGR